MPGAIHFSAGGELGMALVQAPQQQELAEEQDLKKQQQKATIEGLTLQNDERKLEIQSQKDMVARLQRYNQLMTQPESPDHPNLTTNAAGVINQVNGGMDVPPTQISAAAKSQFDQASYYERSAKAALEAFGPGPVADAAMKNAREARDEGLKIQKQALGEREQLNDKFGSALTTAHDESTYKDTYAFLNSQAEFAPLVKAAGLTGVWAQDKTKVAALERLGLARKDAMNFDTEQEKARTDIEEKKAQAANFRSEITERYRKHLEEGEGEALTPGGLKVAEEFIAAQRPVPGGWSKSGINRGNAMLNQIALDERGGPGSGAVTSSMADYTANRASLVQQQKQVDAYDRFNDKIKLDIPVLEKAAETGLAGGVRLTNEPVNALAAKFSDPDLNNLKQAMYVVGLEYERLLTGGALSTAQLHEGAREDAKKLLNADMSKDELKAILPLILTEIRNGETAAHNKLADIRERTRNSSPYKTADDDHPAPPSRSSGNRPSLDSFERHDTSAEVPD